MSAEPFAIFRKNSGHDKSIVEKSDSIYMQQFSKIDKNIARFDSYDSNGRPYSRFIYVKPFFCNCKTFGTNRLFWILSV